MADCTCCSIKYSGFLPEIRLRNKIPSAFFDTWFALPGKIIIGKIVAFFSATITG